MNVIRRVLRGFFPLFLGLSLWCPQRALAEHWLIATLEWPPFTCARCPENGAAASALRQVMKSVDVDVEFEFLSWTQALKKGAKPPYVGYFPVWPESVRPGFSPSPVLFRSPVGFIEPRNKPLVWKVPADLKGKHIGFVQDYSIPTELAVLMRDKSIHSEYVMSDDANVRRVALEKLDGALIDLNNARYFLTISMKPLAGRVSINSRILEDKPLLMSFNPSSAAKSAKIQEALSKVSFETLVDQYLVKYLKHN